MARRFWTSDDVVHWIYNNTPTNREEAVKAAVWWCCYRDTEALVDDTVKHIAQVIEGGIGPYSEDDVTDRVRDWVNQEGDEGDVSGVDDEIEADLRDFFLKE